MLMWKTLKEQNNYSYHYYYYYYYCNCFLLFHSLEFFIRVFAFTEVWVTTSLLRCPGFFWVFSSILTMLCFLRCWFFLWFSNPLFVCFIFKLSETVPSALIIISIMVTNMFLSIFNPPVRSKYFSIFSLSFTFTLRSAGTSKSPRWHVLAAIR